MRSRLSSQIKLDDDFLEKAEDSASFIRSRSSDDLLLISHIDADGLTSAGISSLALDRAGIEHETWFSKQLDENDLREIENAGFSTVIFTDFGSGLTDEIRESDFDSVVADHHQPQTEMETEDGDLDYHLNPLLFGIDGSSEISGAGTSYVLARALIGEDAKDLAALAAVGAVGDMQDSKSGRLTGANREIVKEGVEAGVLEERTDLLLFGRQTRDLPRLFEYSTDVYLPGVTNSRSGAVDFLEETGVRLRRANGDWRRWADFSDDERQQVTNSLMEHCITNGVDSDEIDRLVGETYVLTQEEPGTEVRDATEFSTLLNSTARYREAETGLAVCKGDRDEAYSRAHELLKNHRRNLKNGVDFVDSNGVTKLENLQYFDARSEIRDTIVGIIAGMSYSLGSVSRSMPIVAFADSEEDRLDAEDETKVSARGTQSLVRKGLDLSDVMSSCASEVDGGGGGHDIAAGATIPTDELDRFVHKADAMIGEQLS
ncbi:DHH family phosphoesterase [Halorutilales archaeon Cl-col2-1]